jgi:hypothetical protein
MPERIRVAVLGQLEHAFDNEAFTWREERTPAEFDVPYEDLRT